MSRKRHWLAFGAFLWASFAVSFGRADGKLSRLREDVRTPSAPNPLQPEQDESKSKQGSQDADDDDDEGILEGILGDLFGGGFGEVLWVGVGTTALAPFWVPRTFIDEPSTRYFAEYPYQRDLPGYMIAPWHSEEPYPLSRQARTEYADSFDGVTRIGQRLLFDTTLRFGVDAEFNDWHESIPGIHDDSLWTGDANLLYRFAQSERVQMRTGLGCNWLADDVGADFGFNFTYQGDFFPRDPWVLSTEIDWGTLGDETLFHGRVSAGLHWHRAEIFVGYDYYDVDRTHMSALVGGIRLWF